MKGNDIRFMQSASYSAVVSAMTSMMAKMFMEYMLTDERQEEFAQLLFAYKAMGLEEEEGEES